MGRRRKIDPAAARAAAAEMDAFDAQLNAGMKAREAERATVAAEKAETERHQLESRAAVARCVVINGHSVADRDRFALVKSEAPLPPATRSEAGARRLTEEEEDEMHAEHVATKRANFGDRAGKHGPLSATRVPVLLRIPKYGVYDLLEQMAVRNGMSVTALIIQAATILARVDPDRYHEAMTGLARYGPKTPVA